MRTALWILALRLAALFAMTGRRTLVVDAASLRTREQLGMTAAR